MKNLFLDSNIWLSLYNFSNDDLEQFEKLEDLLDKDIKLYIPEQVRDEVLRNRENKFKDALKNFDISIPQFPAFSKVYSEYKTFSEQYRLLKNDFYTWKNKIVSDFNNRCLPADLVINRFFEENRIIPSKSFAAKAELRYKLGNPPGKNNSLGDAINWECLLSEVPDKEDLYFVGTDKDYRSVVDNKRFSSFLQEEWTKHKQSQVVFYSELAVFLREHISEVKLKETEEKMDLIRALNESFSFATTHAIISSLRKYSFSNEEIELLCQAVEMNNQVTWVFQDSDVFAFYKKILLNIQEDDYENDSPVRKVLSRISQIEESRLSFTDFEI